MRKVLGVFLAVAMLAPIGVIGAAPAGAAASGTTCKSFGGTGSFTPSLPKLGTTGKVKAVLTASGSMSGCSGTVSSGSFKFVSSKSAAENCKTLATAPTPTIKATGVITWNTKATSTFAIKITEVPMSPLTNQVIAGTITAGLFAGRSLKGKLAYAPLNGGCTTTGLAQISFQATGPITIK